MAGCFAMSGRSGLGFDSHRLVEGRRLVLGGIEIEGARRGLEGHSDADVLTHAVIDALLGAACLGDIGQHFPDSDERYRDADSLELLGEVRVLLERSGWAVRHLDTTVICERPRLGGHRDAMRGALARAAGLGQGEVNVKFTTAEGMGLIGSGEGIAAQAIVTVEPRDRGRGG